jgi:hypothetical protein
MTVKAIVSAEKCWKRALQGNPNDAQKMLARQF